MTGLRDPAVEEEEAEEEGVTTRSGADWEPDRSALATRELVEASEEAV